MLKGESCYCHYKVASYVMLKGACCVILKRQVVSCKGGQVMIYLLKGTCCVILIWGKMHCAERGHNILFEQRYASHNRAKLCHDKRGQALAP